MTSFRSSSLVRWAFVSAASAFTLGALVDCTTTGLPVVTLDSAVDEVDAAKDDSAVSSGGSSSSSSGSSGVTDAGRDGDAALPPFAVTINEIAGTDEWVELLNTSAASVDLSGYLVADSAKDGSGPKRSEALKFPVGTMLAPGGYIVVAGKRPLDAGAGELPPVCGGGDAGDAGAPIANCYWADWGIGLKGGETMYILNPQDQVVMVRSIGS
jgi:Lamin Tail Domain